MKTLHRPLGFAAAVALLSSCGGGGSDVIVVPQHASYEAASCVGLVVANHRAFSTVMVDHCDPALERLREDGAWESHPYQGDGCLLFGLGVSGGDRTGFTAALPAELAPGTYRFRVGMNWEPSQERFVVASEPFGVAGAAAAPTCAMDGTFDPDEG